MLTCTAAQAFSGGKDNVYKPASCLLFFFFFCIISSSNKSSLLDRRCKVMMYDESVCDEIEGSLHWNKGDKHLHWAMNTWQCPQFWLEQHTCDFRQQHPSHRRQRWQPFRGLKNDSSWTEKRYRGDFSRCRALVSSRSPKFLSKSVDKRQKT